MRPLFSVKRRAHLLVNRCACLGASHTADLTCFPVSGPIFAGKFQFSG
jgi:hypothetical protein